MALVSSLTREEINSYCYYQQFNKQSNKRLFSVASILPVCRVMIDEIFDDGFVIELTFEEFIQEISCTLSKHSSHKIGIG